ncbi:hypothetical protein S83_042361, partial [Arachis hypogaea]
VGADEFGYMLANILKENNVDMSGMRFDPNARTALAFVTLRADGKREFLFYPNLRLALWPSAEAARKGIMSIWDQADVIYK